MVPHMGQFPRKTHGFCGKIQGADAHGLTGVELMVEAPFGRHQAIETLGHVYSLYKLCHIHSTV